MRTIEDYNFNGKKAIIRVDFNAPLDEQHKVTDNTRIVATIPTIKKILADGGAVILMSHLGRPKEGPNDHFSLRHILPELSRLLGQEVKFATDCLGERTELMAETLQAGEVLLLENLRFYKEETAGDAEFAHKLAQLGDVYVNDAFGTAHRAHASTAVIARYFPDNKVFGYIMANEIKNIDKVLKSSERPLTAILGGAKVSGKIQIINQLLDQVDNLIIGGGMMFTFIKAMGGNVGNSLVEDDLLELARNTVEGAKMMGTNLYIPVDAMIADGFSNDANKKECNAFDIPEGWMGLDIGSQSMTRFADVIGKSSTILWNGPMGVFEMPNFETGTHFIADSVAKITEKGAFSLVGGGDSIAAINKYKLADKVSYVSTGGGAMLEYLEGKLLPGIDAILNKDYKIAK